MRLGLASRFSRLARALPRWVARYAVVALLGGTLVRAVLVPMLWGERPRPKVPADGFVSEDLSVRLSWDRGDAKEALQLELSKDDPSFRRPVLRQATRATSHNLPPLERGRTYYWRLEPGGVTSWFRTSRYGAHF